jgi:GxxExxY protein
MSKLKHAELTEKILCCSFEVHSQLGAGFLEKVYENALVIELVKRGLSVEQQKQLCVTYKGNVVGDYIADLVVDNSVIVELKAIEKVTDIHEVQLKNYLCATGIEVGLLLNFGKTVQVRRKFVENQSRVIPKLS